MILELESNQRTNILIKYSRELLFIDIWGKDVYM